MAIESTATILYDTQFQAFGDDGAVVALGTVTVTSADNGDAVDSYTTGQRTAKNPYPVVLSASGKADIFLDNGLYNIVVKDSTGLIVRTIEDFSPALSSTKDIASILSTNEWIISSDTALFLSLTSFVIDTDVTGEYIEKRRVRLNQSINTFYSQVASSTYDSITDKTTIVIEDNGITLDLESVDYSLISPFLETSGGSLRYQDNPYLDKSISHNITADADYTLVLKQNMHTRIEITDTSTFLTAARNIIVNNVEHTFLFVNSTLQDLTVKTSLGIGISVLAGEKRELRNDTINIVQNQIDGIMDSLEVQKLSVLDGFDLNQSWVDVTASRSEGVNYTNPHNKPMYVSVRANAGLATFTVDGIDVTSQYITATTARVSVFFIVPIGGVYKMTEGTPTAWTEYY